jgi:hypothetical protein
LFDSSPLAVPRQARWLLRKLVVDPQLTAAPVTIATATSSPGSKRLPGMRRTGAG